MRVRTAIAVGVVIVTLAGSARADDEALKSFYAYREPSKSLSTRLGEARDRVVRASYMLVPKRSGGSQVVLRARAAMAQATSSLGQKIQNFGPLAEIKKRRAVRRWKTGIPVMRAW
jgi:hypothetical protein